MITESDILKAKILIVDDLEANVLVLEQMLANAGYTSITTTMEPDKVCELHLVNRYDLILLDLLMPKMDGFAVMENLKTIETSGYLPVLVVTAQSDHKLRALKAGARDFISKPFELGEVLIRVHNLLEVRLLHKESLELNARVLEEKKVSQRLLLDLLPAPVAEKMAANPASAASLATGSSAEVAVLFLDIVAFTTFSEGADAEVLIGVLNGIAERQGDKQPDKGKALDSAYLATAGLPDALANHTIATADKALELMEAVDRFNTFSPFKLKVNLSVGTANDR